MTSSWTREGVQSLAPDAGSLKSAVGLAKARQWQLLEYAQQTLWGEIQGSGSTPYQTRIDLSEPAFKCNCPSRKFPCKHGLALMLLYVEDQSAFKSAAPPDWVSDWLAGREQRAEKRTAKAEAAPPADPQAQAKRAQAREAKIAQGLNELQTWLQDLARIGLAKARTQQGFGTSVAARLVDAQAGALAREVERLAQICASGEGWETRALDQIARIELITRAYRAQERLGADLREDARAALGWTQAQDEVLRGAPHVQDRWHVCGHGHEHEAQVSSRRTWLYGENSQRYALLLAFAAGNQPLPPAQPIGRCFDAALAWFPGAAATRALVATQGERQTFNAYPCAQTIAQALAAYARLLAKAPWSERAPFCIEQARLHLGANDAAYVIDAEAAALPVAKQFAFAWHWFAVAGGAPAQVFGEWDGFAFMPLALACEGCIYEFARGERARLTPMSAHASR